MATTPKDTRDAAEAKLSRAQKTTDEAKGIPAIVGKTAALAN